MDCVLLIRDFHPKDLQQVTALIAETFNRNYNPEFYLSLMQRWGSGFMVAEDERGVIGVLTAMISAPKEGRILLMAVQPSYRNRGIGTQLLKEFISRCFILDLKAVNLEVRISNEKAIRFYDSHGFNILSLLPSYYEDGEAGYLMKKVL
ncbi:MAG: ribosomal protein S18-alanine N-acetyltransferase [Thermoplasmata archaeon]|nr:MAG: ribosomal protein S18-alanine N-acetyltransferase [Thermoplasmata archaeon]